MFVSSETERQEDQRGVVETEAQAQNEDDPNSRPVTRYSRFIMMTKIILHTISSVKYCDFHRIEHNQLVTNYQFFVFYIINPPMCLSFYSKTQGYL